MCIRDRGNTIYAIVSTIFLALFNWKIGLITLVGIILNFFVLTWIQKKSDLFAVKQINSKELMTTRVMELIQGIMTMRLFSYGENDLKRVNEAFREKKEADLLVENTVTSVAYTHLDVYKRQNHR